MKGAFCCYVLTENKRNKLASKTVYSGSYKNGAKRPERLIAQISITHVPQIKGGIENRKWVIAQMGKFKKLIEKSLKY